MFESNSVAKRVMRALEMITLPAHETCMSAMFNRALGSAAPEGWLIYGLFDFFEKELWVRGSRHRMSPA